MSPSTSQSAANRTLQNFSTRLPSPSNSVILGTALVDVYKDDLKYTVRALIDSASEATFISKNCKDNLNTRVSEVQIHGLKIDLLLGGDVYPKIIQDGLQWWPKDCVSDGLLLARISSIHEKLGKNAWSYVNFKNHLAYLTSRKSTNSELSNNELWWHGPPWLECPYSEWPSRIAVLESMEEERPLQGADHKGPAGKAATKRLNRDVTDAYRNLRLADPDFFESNTINFVFGADIYPKIIRSGLHITTRGSPIAQDTVLGWVIIGIFST
ncbi:hypothetical protein EVAR_73440_1 [Eumeta japonica]|uniref:Peptidase aspartic putative domain-containing protein n=1 Tax=Eumeta variegata TaxID=151549 RepID=A0A4C1SNP3_EUMVA|nr:hypothetical protein EVAR_73440_1 [Eumeta japonica]